MIPRPPPDDDLPGTLRALVRAMQIAYRAQPRLLVVSFLLTATASIPDALVALWLKWLANGVVERDGGRILSAAAGMAASGIAAWVLTTLGGRVNSRFSQLATVEIEAHVAELQASVATLEHHERPAYLDRLQLLRDQSFLLNHLYGAFFGTLGSVARLGFTIALLMSIHPSLILLGVFAVPTVVVATWRAGQERAASEGAAWSKRLGQHLFDLGTMAGPGKEIRVSRTGELLVRRHRDAHAGWVDALNDARWSSAIWHTAAWSLFGAAYVGAIVFVSAMLHSSAGDVLLVLAAGGRLSQFIGTTVGEADFLRWTLDAAKRLAWLEDYAVVNRDAADLDAPGRIEHGIKVDGVSFRYPGTDKLVLEGVDVDLPAGSVVAIVGENGAGKTTLVKLLCRMYEPTAGEILVDGVPLGRIPAGSWRERVAGAFQDFFRFEFLARRTVGLGDLEHLEDVPAVSAAVGRAGADDVVTRLASGLDTQLGPTWDGGVELSFGQWQKLALARGFMRDRPLLLVLDEPTAALDAETEHALFERFAAASRESREDGRITILVSHRFSTVRMADLIVVLDGAHVVECGSHEDLIARGGLYAELYGIQAAAYR